MAGGGVMPQRIQRKRVRGWRMPENTVYVGRPTVWGNPYISVDPAHAVERYRVALTECLTGVFRPETGNRLRDFHPFSSPDLLRHELVASLRGKDLACWCKAGQPCHADVLLEVANGGAQ